LVRTKMFFGLGCKKMKEELEYPPWFKFLKNAVDEARIKAEAESKMEKHMENVLIDCTSHCKNFEPKESKEDWMKRLVDAVAKELEKSSKEVENLPHKKQGEKSDA